MSKPLVRLAKTCCFLYKDCPFDDRQSTPPGHWQRALNSSFTRVCSDNRLFHSTNSCCFKKNISHTLVDQLYIKKVSKPSGLSFAFFFYSVSGQYPAAERSTCRPSKAAPFRSNPFPQGKRSKDWRTRSCSNVVVSMSSLFWGLQLLCLPRGHPRL